MQSLTITLIQTHLHWEDKAANLAMLEQKILNLSDKTELGILPEMFSTGFSMKPQLLAETMDAIYRAAETNYSHRQHHYRRRRQLLQPVDLDAAQWFLWLL